MRGKFPWPPFVAKEGGLAKRDMIDRASDLNLKWTGHQLNLHSACTRRFSENSDCPQQSSLIRFAFFNPPVTHRQIPIACLNTKSKTENRV